MAAQGIVAGIRQGCEMLSQGRAEISKLKKTVEGGVADAKAIYSEVAGLWGWIKGLFGSKPPARPSVAVATSEAKSAGSGAAKPAARKHQERAKELSYEEYQTQAVHQICEQLKQFFEIRRQLIEYCKQLEEESKTTTDIEGAALDRIQIEMQLEQMTVQIRETMIYTPKEIGLQSIYSRFLKMYDQILEEREFDRQLKRRQRIDEEWQQEYRRRIRFAKLGYAVVVLLALLEMTGLFLHL
jgi:hypothetical protein